MRIVVILAAVAVVAFGLAWSLGCCSTPNATSLAGDEGEIRVVEGDASLAPAACPRPP